MDYPEAIICGQRSPNMSQSSICDGTAHHYPDPPIIISNDRGDWYGCRKCGRLAQYQDFVDGAGPIR